MIYTAITGRPGIANPMWVLERGPHELVEVRSVHPSFWVVYMVDPSRIKYYEIDVTFSFERCASTHQTIALTSFVEYLCSRSCLRARCARLHDASTRSNDSGAHSRRLSRNTACISGQQTTQEGSMLISKKTRSIVATRAPQRVRFLPTSRPTRGGRTILRRWRRGFVCCFVLFESSACTR